MLMLCADAAIPQLDIFGPYGLMHYLATMRGYTYRTTMAVHAVEAASAPVHSLQTGDSPPQPLFKDEHLTVYSIPLYPSVPPEGEQEESVDAAQASEPMDAMLAPEATDRPLKRKRTPSPDGPARRKSPPLTDHALDSAAPVPETLTARSRSHHFVPGTLTGDEAQEWRKLMLQEMFPMPAPPPATATDSSKGSKEREKARFAKVQAKKTRAAPSEGAADGGEGAEGELPRRAGVPPDKRFARLPPLVEGSDAHGHPALPTLAYLLVGPSVRGKFDVKKAEALGVPRGPIRGKLTRGETVTFDVDDGAGGKVQKTVRAEECVGPSEVAQSVLVLDVPSPEYIPSLMTSFTESPYFSKYRSREEGVREEHPVHAVFHLCGDGVLEDERYKEFMDGFSDKTHHVISSRQHTADKIVFGKSALIQAKLNQLDADMFPVPKYSMEPARSLASVTGLPSNCILSSRNLIVNVRPPRAPTMDDKAREDEFIDVATTGAPPELADNLLEKFAEVKATVSERVGRNSPAANPGDDVVVTTLGTGSAIPTTLRNVSGTLIQIPGEGTILLDCGEGTWGQLARSFGNDPAHAHGVWDVLRDLKCIFLSHMHGDHHMGVSKILQMRTRMDPPPSQPLYVVGLRPHLMYLTERNELEDLGLGGPNGVILVLSDALNWRPPQRYARIQPDDEPFMNSETSLQHARDMCRALGLQRFTTVDVAHRVRCYGCVLRHQSGWSIAFSADTMPAENLVRVGRGATLLIHESSLSPEEEALAREKAHSTSAQAIDVGRRMKAQKLLLTHFSARYPGMPPRQDDGREARRDEPLVGLAFDFARIRLGDMWKLNAYLPAIQRMFDEVGEDPMEIDLTKSQ
ncbi:beta-lactamase-like protein [Trametes polyzona]|nr:beta-lactamase-like protein [Trametes polyzona]